MSNKAMSGILSWFDICQDCVKLFCSCFFHCICQQSCRFVFCTQPIRRSWLRLVYVSRAVSCLLHPLPICQSCQSTSLSVPLTHSSSSSSPPAWDKFIFCPFCASSPPDRPFAGPISAAQVPEKPFILWLFAVSDLGPESPPCSTDLEVGGWWLRRAGRKWWDTEYEAWRWNTKHETYVPLYWTIPIWDTVWKVLLPVTI